MILKSLTRKNNTLQLVNYLFKERLNEKVKPILKHNLRSNSMTGWAKEFEVNDTLRLYKRADNIKVFHTILSFSNKDKEHINHELLVDIAKKFVELRGQENLYLAASHTDKDHIHLHIIVSGTKYLTGESNRISKKDFQELKLALDLYQKENYPKLVNSLPDHGRLIQKLQSSLDSQSPESSLRNTQKQQIMNSTQQLYRSSKSLDHFLIQLKTVGLEPYYRGGKVYGVESEGGRHFRFNTLGIHQHKLAELDQNEKSVDKALKEISDLRNSKTQVIAREISRNEVKDSVDTNPDLEYDGLGL